VGRLFIRQGGRIMMNHIKQNFFKEIDDYILEGYPSYEKLPQNYKHNLVALHIKTLNQNDAFECISESDDLDVTIDKLRKFIFSGCTEEALELAETMRKNAEKYLSNKIKALYNERIPIIETEKNLELGLKPYQHKDNGETTWIRA
jgi:hypothetical protein